MAAKKGNNANNKPGKDALKVVSYHVSCRSDQVEKYVSGEDLAGVVLYAKGKDGKGKPKQDWYWNGVHCKSGYIIVKKTKNIQKYESNAGIVHGKVFQSVFKEDPDNTVVSGGFARMDNVWKYNSWTCNAANNQFTDGKKEMGDTEKQAVSAAIQNWIGTRKQNWKLDEPLYIHPN